MRLSEAIREWKRKITTHMAVEYVLTLRTDINAFSDAAQALEGENAKLRELAAEMWDELDATTQYDAGGGRGVLYEFVDRMRKLGIEVDE